MKLSDFYKKNEMISLIFTETASKMANRSSHFLPWFWSFTSVFLVVRAIAHQNTTNLKIIYQVSRWNRFGSDFYRGFPNMCFSMAVIGIFTV